VFEVIARVKHQRVASSKEKPACENKVYISYYTNATKSHRSGKENHYKGKTEMLPYINE
jgi:hypothetical protein